ncbi:MAG: hypothetical protein DRJ67_11515 [Thermoprotei archaeon]|nr:MAG: hypothetical protein DRJ67_11515 [Thermoprotei archaeon]
MTLPLHAASLVAAAICLVLPPEALGPELRVTLPRLGPAAACVAAHVYAAALRALPEALYWPYLVGFDTVEYAAAVRDLPLYGWAPFGRTWWYGGWSNRPPLLYALLYLPALAGADVLLLMKVVPPLIYGLLGFSAALWGLRAGLGGWGALACAVFVSSYYVVLGFSWQLLANVLGVALALLALAFLEDYVEGGSPHLFVILSAAACAAHPTAAVMIAAVCSLLLLLRVRELRRAVVVAGVALLAFLATAWYLELRPLAPAAAAGGAPVPRPAGVSVSTEGLVARFLRRLAGYYYLLAPFAAYAALRLRGLTCLKLLFLSFATAWALLLFAGFTYSSPLRLAVVPSPLVALLAFLGLRMAGGRRLLAAYMILVIATGLHYACSRRTSVIMANMFPGAFEGETYFPSGMVSSILSPELQGEAMELGRLLYGLANESCPAFIVGANYYVYAHLAGGFNPHVTWILSTHEVKGRLAAMGLSLDEVRGAYLLSPRGWLPDWASGRAKLLSSTEHLELMYLDRELLANLTTLIIVTP